MARTCRAPKTPRTVTRIEAAAGKAGWDTRAECFDTSRPRDWFFEFTCRTLTPRRSWVGFGLWMKNCSIAYLLSEIREMTDDEWDCERQDIFRDFYEKLKNELTKNRIENGNGEETH